MSLKITGGNNILREKKERRKCFTGMIKKYRGTMKMQPQPMLCQAVDFIETVWL